MRVAFYLADQNPHRDRTLGVTGYTDGLIAALRDQAPDLELCACVSRSSYAPEPPLAETGQISGRTDRLPGRLMADQLHPLRRLPAADVWHYPKGHLPSLLSPRRPAVGTVHDTILQYYADHYPESRSAAAFGYWLTVLKRSISRFDLVITVSQFSEGAIREFCDRYRLRCPEIVVTGQGCRFEKEPQPDPAAITKQEAVLHLASGGPHKGTLALLRHWEAADATALPPLCLVGSLSPEAAAIAGRLSRVEVKGRVDEAALKAAITSARAVLIPSEIEGFGLPALEADHLGTPVVYGNGTSIAEVLGTGAPGGFDLKSGESFVAALNEVLQLSPQEIAETGHALRERHSWAACAEKTIGAYEAVLA